MKWLIIFILFLAVGCAKKSERSTEPLRRVEFVCMECGWERSRFQTGWLAPDVCSECKNDIWRVMEGKLPLVMKKAKDDDGMPHAED